MKLGALVALAALACACGDANDGAGLQRRLHDSARGPAATKDPSSDEVDTTTPPASSPTPEAPPPEEAKPTPEPDADADGVPDARDCEPQNAAVVGTRLIDDALAVDAAIFAPATGFPASWAYATEAYRQERLVNGADATLFKKNTLLADVDITAGSTSTEITSTISPRLRQMFVLVGARTEGDVFTAYRCGAEVVQGMSPEQQTSVVKLTGKPDAIVTTPIQRTAHNVLLETEFSIRAQVKGGKITCTVSQGAGVVTTAEASGLADATGAIGFYTRQTKAAFKNVKACKLQ